MQTAMANDNAHRAKLKMELAQKYDHLAMNTQSSARRRQLVNRARHLRNQAKTLQSLAT
jgi:hypothetical protein